ncbi:MAG: hypothetical protein MHMPM18_000999 [Marteilia pararefringens]
MSNTEALPLNQRRDPSCGFGLHCLLNVLIYIRYCILGALLNEFHESGWPKLSYLIVPLLICECICNCIESMNIDYIYGQSVSISCTSLYGLYKFLLSVPNSGVIYILYGSLTSKINVLGVISTLGMGILLICFKENKRRYGRIRRQCNNCCGGFDIKHIILPLISIAKPILMGGIMRRNLDNFEQAKFSELDCIIFIAYHLSILLHMIIDIFQINAISKFFEKKSRKIDLRSLSLTIYALFYLFWFPATYSVFENANLKEYTMYFEFCMQVICCNFL